MENRNLRVGFIGCGSIARHHVRMYKDIDNADIVAGCDIIPGKAEQFFKDMEIDGAHCYTSYEEMIDKENLDAVSVCTYNRQHAAPTIYALDHGVNVLCEKPFAVTLDECVEMMRAEKRSGKILSIGFQPRFDPNMQQIKRIVESGELGQIYYIQTGGGRRTGIPTSVGHDTFIQDATAGVGAVGDIGCYSLDLVLNAVGYPTPLTVSGFKFDLLGTNPDTYRNINRYAALDPEKTANLFSVDDFAGALVRLEGGIMLDFRISWAININTTGDTLIIGTKAGLRIPSTSDWNGSLSAPMKIYRQCAGLAVETEVPLIPTKDNDAPWKGKISSFLDAVRNGGKAPVPTSEIIKNQAIIDGIMRSSACGHEVTIEIPEI